MTYENNGKRMRRGALGFVVVTAVAAVPALGCSGSEEEAVADMSAPADEGSPNAPASPMAMDMDGAEPADPAGEMPEVAANEQEPSPVNPSSPPSMEAVPPAATDTAVAAAADTVAEVPSSEVTVAMADAGTAPEAGVCNYDEDVDEYPDCVRG